jgi:excisionase family DNA binding protein
MMNVNVDDVVTVRQASEITGAHEVKIRRWIREGKLQVIRLGYSLVLPKAELRKLSSNGK